MEKFTNQIKKLVTKGAIVASIVLPMKEGLKAQERIDSKAEIENYFKTHSQEALRVIATLKSDSINNESGIFLSPKADTVEVDDRTLILKPLHTSEGIKPGFQLKDIRKDGLTYKFEQKNGVVIHLSKNKDEYNSEAYTVKNNQSLKDFLDGKEEELGPIHIRKFVEVGGRTNNLELEGKDAVHTMKPINDLLLEDLKIIQEYQKNH